MNFFVSSGATDCPRTNPPFQGKRRESGSNLLLKIPIFDPKILLCVQSLG